MEDLLVFFKKAIPLPLIRLFRPVYHFTLALAAAVWYNFPSRRLTVIGVTGTNGKTTVVHLLHEIFRAAGHNVGSLSSLRFKINDEEKLNTLKMTMPGRFTLQGFLAHCRKAGCRFALIEVTSEGIAQFRHCFIHFSSAVLTNVTPEHIEAHGSFESYRSAKGELFRILPASGYAVLNQEDETAKDFANITPAKIVWYSPLAIELQGVGHPVRLAAATVDRIQLEIDNIFIESKLGGEFNVKNILAASAAAMALGIPLQTISQALRHIGPIPGRLEVVVREPFRVVVDYAHTPDALERVYTALAAASSPLVCVLGAAGGGRDKWKRPQMGKIASRFCRAIILTSEDPDDEDPLQIASEIRSGIPNDKIQITKTVIDRREAIGQALRDSRPGDTTIITGMGAQPWFIVKGGKIPWDDRAVAREELGRLQNQIVNQKLKFQNAK